MLTLSSSVTFAASSAGDFGKYPKNFKKTVMSYLAKNNSKPEHDLSTTEFLNTPDKYIDENLFSSDEYGYRVCALIRQANGRTTNTHFFLIKNNKVIEHKQDRGAITLSDDYCGVTELLRARARNEAVVTETPKKPSTPPSKTGIKYIICSLDGDEKFFAYNSRTQQLQEEYDGRVVSTYSIAQASETFIVAENETTRTSINRVSGTMIYLSNGVKSKGSCKLTSQQRF